MTFPNAASLALIAAVTAALKFFVAGAEGLSDDWWVPIVILSLGAVAKALEVYLQEARGIAPASTAGVSPFWRWLLR